jgi:hypothetical protein
MARPTFQYVEDDEVGAALTQTSIPVQIVVPFQRQWQLSVRGSGAAVSSDDLENLSGLSDVQVAVSYARQVGEGSLIVTGTANAPTGKQELSSDELLTARLLSQSFYRFRVPSFGQGFGAGAGVTWALPVSDVVVLGFGGSFGYRGAYEPFEAQADEYDPGEEVRLTAGIDFRLSRTSALSADVSAFTYGTDTINGTNTFEAGNQITARIQYLLKTGFQTFRAVARYRGQQKSVVPVTEGTNQQLQVLPSQASFRTRFSTRVSDGIFLGGTLSSQWYDKTEAFQSKFLFRGSLEPQFVVGDHFVMIPRIAYAGGDITGVEGGLGLLVRR